jgi:hypothetical protein
MFAQFLGHKKSLGSASYVACSEDAYWSSVALLMHFDGVSTNSFIDETGKTVTVNGGTLITADNKKFGQGSGYFDGTGDYLSIRDGRLNLGTGDFTIECWVYFNNKTGYQSLLSKGYIATGDLLVQTAQNTSSFKFYASGTLIATESSEASLNTWHHYAFVRKSGVLYIYRDGSVTGSGACAQDLTNAFALKIGVGTHLVDGSYYFTGYIDEVRITKGIARYDSNSTKLLAHFDSPPATLDAMGNTADTGRTQPSIISGGVFNSCAEFSSSIGANPSLTVPTIGSTYTIEFFIKNRPGTTASGYILCLCSDLNNSSGYNFSIDTNSVLFYNGSYLTFSVSISSCLTPDTWNHVAIVCNASSLKLYVNGSLKDTINSGFNLTAHSLQIGYQKWGSTWYLSDMLLDEIRISNNVRYSGNFAVPTSEFIPDGNTVVLMHFNEIASGGLVDVTGRLLTVNGNIAVTNTQSKFGGYSAYFDGTGDYLTIPASSDFNFGTSDFTIECWVNAGTQLVQYGTIFTSSVSGSGITLFVADSAASGFASLCIGSTRIITTGVSIVDSTWHHLALVRQSGVFKLFLDGALTASTSGYIGNLIDNSSSVIGYSPWAPEITYFKGYIDELRITKGAAVYNRQIMTRSLLHFENTVQNVSVSSYPALSKAGSLSCVDTISKFGDTSLDVNNGYLYTGTQDWELSDFTLSFWIYPKSWAGVNSLFATDRNGIGGMWLAVLSGSLGTWFQPTHGESWAYFGSAPTINTWHYIMLTRIGSTTTLYVDGVSIGNPVFGTYALKFNWTYGVSIGQAFYNGSPYGDPLIANLNDYVLKNVGTSDPTVPTGHPTYNPSTDLVFAKFNDAVGLISGNLQIIDSVSGNSISVYGGIAYSDSMVKVNSYSLQFPVGSRIVVSGSKLNLGTSDFTIEYWMYLTAYTSGNGVHYNVQVDARAGGSGPLIALDANKKLFHTSSTVGTSVIALNTWYHVAWVRHNSTLTLYVNGVAEGSVSDAGNYASTIWALGNAYTGNDGWSLTGYLDEFHITDTAKYTSNFTPSVAANTASSITYSPSGAIVSFPPTAPFTYEGSSIGITNPLPPIAAFPSCRKTWTGTADAYCGNVILLLNADGLATDTVFYDDSILAQPVTKNGTVAYNTTVHKFWDSSAYFNGAGSLQVPHSSDFDFGTSDFTIETWMYRTADTDSLIYDKRINATVADNIGISPRSGGAINLYCSSNGSGWDMFGVTVATGIGINTWYHIALVRSGSTWMFFVNGALTWTGTSSAAVHANTYPVTIGSASGLGYPFTGYLSDYRVTKGVSRYGSNPTKLLMHFNQANILTDAMMSNSFNSIGSPVLSSTCKIGSSSLYLNGSSYFSNSSTSGIGDFGTGDFTVEAWIKVPTLSVPYGIINFGNDTQNVNCFSVIIQPTYGIGALTGRNSVDSNFYPLDGDWHHMAISRQGTTLRIFVDGVVKYTGSNSVSYIQAACHIGQILNSYNYVGYLDELRVSKGIARYTADFTPSVVAFTTDAYTTLLLHFDGAAGTSFASWTEDTGKSVTIYGNTVISNAQSKFGGYSGYFDGTGDYLTVAASTDFAFGTGDFTIECWYYPVSRVNSYPIIFGACDGNWAANTWYISDRHTYYPTQFFFTMFNGYGGANQVALLSASTVTNNTWYHLAVTRKSNIWTLFVNGVAEATATSSLAIDAGSAAPLYIGGTTLGNSWGVNGYIDEFRILKGVAIVPALTGDTALLHCDSLPVIDTVGLATWTAGSSVTLDTSIKKFGAGSYKFVANGDSYIRTTNSAIVTFGSSDFTMECWVNLTQQSVVDGHTLIVSYSGGGFCWAVNSSTWVGAGKASYFHVYTGGCTLVSNSNYLSLNTWHHLALVRNGTSVSLFIDGVLDASVTVAANLSINPVGASEPVSIGNWKVGYQFDGNYPLVGYMEEFRITKGLARYIASFTPAAQAYASIQSPSILDQDGNPFPPTQPYSYTGAVTALGGSIPPTDKLLKCGAGTV